MTSKVVYRIYTEYRENLPELTEQYFSGFSIFQGIGYWQGASEPSAIIEIVGTLEQVLLIDGLRAHIATVNKQESVALTMHTVDTNGF